MNNEPAPKFNGSHKQNACICFSNYNSIYVIREKNTVSRLFKPKISRMTDFYLARLSDKNIASGGMFSGGPYSPSGNRRKQNYCDYSSVQVNRPCYTKQSTDQRTACLAGIGEYLKQFSIERR